MRHLPVRPLATSAFCVALALGGAAPVAAAGGDPVQAPEAQGNSSSRDFGDEAAAVAAAEALHRLMAAQPQAEGVLTPVSRLVDAVLAADDHRLTPAEAQRHSGAVHAAIARAQAQAPAAQDTTSGAASTAGAPQNANLLPDYLTPDQAARQGQSGHEHAAKGKHDGKHEHGKKDKHGKKHEHGKKHDGKKHEHGAKHEHGKGTHDARHEHGTQHASAHQQSAVGRQRSAQDAALIPAAQTAPEVRTRALTRLQAATDTLILLSTANDKEAVDRQIPVVVRAARHVAVTTSASQTQARPGAAVPPAAPNDRQQPARPQQQAL